MANPWPKMVTQLAAFLRHALVERALQTTTLAAELDALQGYLAIEQIRFEERLAHRPVHVQNSAYNAPASSRTQTGSEDDR